jgi:ATP-dependent HslUV protease ATP-binding subunit HslU
MAEEVMPKNIIMIGPTGVGKTEIATAAGKACQFSVSEGGSLEIHRSRICRPGRRIMIRDLVEISIDMVRNEKLEEVADKADAMQKIASSICFCRSSVPRPNRDDSRGGNGAVEPHARKTATHRLRDGKLDERTVEIEVKERNFPASRIISNQGVEEMDINIKDILPGFFGQRPRSGK